MTTRGGARIRAFRRCLVALAALCVLAATLSVSTASAAPKMSVVVSPATNLGDQVVDVEWSGFRQTRFDGTYAVVVMQCRANPHSVLRDCNTAETFPFSLTGNQETGVTHKDGTGHVFMDIMTTSRLPSLGCSETHPCSLLVYETTDDGFDPARLPPNRVIVPLQFAHSFADCPPVTSFDFRMETESSSASALYRWAAHFCTGDHAFTVDVTNTSSDAARENLFSKQVDIAVSSAPPGPDEVTPTTPKYSVVPLDYTAVVVAYNIIDPSTHKAVTDLTLSPRLVARLISDSDLTSFFHDPEFRKLNPHHHWPGQAAAPGLRAEQNADTGIVTNWVNGNDAARKFLDGHDKYGIQVNPAWNGVHYPTDIFEARLPDGVYFPRAGEEGVAERLFSSTKPAETIPTDSLNAGFIGVLDLPTAARFRLPVARLTNGVNQPVVTLGAPSADKGFRAMQTSPDGFHTMPARVSNPAAYPLMKVDHAMVPEELTSSPRDQRIRAFLDYAVTEGQQNLPSGYAELPHALMTQTLQYTGDTSLATTTTTTTTTTTLPGRGGVDDGGRGYTDDTGSGYTGDGSSPNATPSSVPRATTGSTTTTTGARQAELAGLRLADSGDRMVLPVVLGLALLALLVRAVEVTRNRTRGWRLRR